MSFFGRLSSFFAQLFRGDDPQTLQRWPSFRPIAGIVLTQDQALSLAAVWACMDIISKSIASCTWNIYEPVPNTKRRRLLDQDPRAWLLNTRPNPDMTAIGFREAMLLQALPSGNSYAEIVTDKVGRPAELWPLIGDRVTPRRDENWRLVYDYVQPTGETVRLQQSQVFHLRGPGLNGLMGDNIIVRAANTLAVAAAQERFSADFFGRGAQLAGVLEIPTKVGAAQHELLRKEWAENHAGGGKNAHKPLILEGGMKFTATSTDPQKASLVEDKKFSVEDVARWFGVPPHKIQHLEHATFSNIEHSSIEFVRDALRPWERRLSQEADYKFFPQTRGPWRQTEIDLSPLTRGDAQSRAQAQASWRQNGIKTANEIRAEEGLDDIGDEGDLLLVQGNLTTIERLTAPPAQPALPPSTEPAEESGDTDEQQLAAMNRDVSRRAVRSALTRYERRLSHRREALKAKADGDAQLNKFRDEQLDVILGELDLFAPHLRAALGRDFTRDDCARCVAAFEGGDAELQSLESTS